MSNQSLRKRTKKMIMEIDLLLLPLSYIVAVLESILPYNMLLITTYVINSLENNVKVVDIMKGVIIILMLRFLLENVTSFLRMKYNERLCRTDYKYRAKKTEKYMKVDYQFAEQGEYENIRQEIRFRDESMGTFYGIVNMYHTLALNVVSIAVAVLVITHMGYSIVASEGKIRGYWIAFFIVIILLTFFSSWITRKLQKKSAEQLPQLYEQMSNTNRLAIYLAEMVVYNYNLGKDIRLYRVDKMISDVFSDMTKNTRPILKRIGSISGSAGLIGNIISLVITGSIYVIIGCIALMGLIPIGNIVLYSGSVNRLVDSITSFIYVWGEIDILAARLEPVFKLFDLPEENQIEDDRVINIKEIESLKFENVWFKYSGADKYALEDISFEIKKNEKIMFVGANGAGKSTVIKLLCGLYKPTKGKIYVNGVDINNISHSKYKQLIKSVFQDFQLFSFSIADNIAVNSDIDRISVENCLEVVGFKDRLSRMKKGIDTPLYQDFDESGVEVSGGEAQKLAMARLIYSNACVTVLDEPTAALDPIAESEIYEKFNDIIKDRTAIFVSHRLSSSKLCDRVFVFDGGKLVQNGTHTELLNCQNGNYFKLWNAQVKYYS